MARINHLVIGSVAFLLFSCAQVGTISGGTKDEFAPKPIENGINPPNQSLNFSSKKIIFSFDEYIKLNNPLENILIVPRGIKIDAKIEKKKLILNLEGNFQENTTYQITFNSAIKDINEGNDSLMHYVFSTGEKIDTISYSGKIADAYTGEKLKNVLVGLYNINDSLAKSKPTYFTKTNEFGEFEFNYLNENSWRVYAFLDENKDMNFQITEKAGFRDSLLELKSNKIDSIPLLIFQSPLPEKINSKSFISPSLVKISTNYSSKKTKFYYKNTLLDQSSIFYYTPDSLALLLPKKIVSDFEIIRQTENKTDTLNFKIGINNQKKSIYNEIHPSNKDISKSKAAMILFSDEIVDIDTNKIIVFSSDSLKIYPKIEFTDNTLAFEFPTSNLKNLNLTLLPNSIKFLNLDESLFDTLNYKLLIKGENEFGSIRFKNLDLPKNALIEFILKNKVVSTRTSQSLLDYPLESMLEPGEYTFRVIIDSNQNQKWDSGSILNFQQAEKVLHFPEKVKLRANWETEVELVLEE